MLGLLAYLRGEMIVLDANTVWKLTSNILRQLDIYAVSAWKARFHAGWREVDTTATNWRG